MYKEREGFAESDDMWMCDLLLNSHEPDCPHRIKIPHFQSFCDCKGVSTCGFIKIVKVMVIEGSKA